jgi:hypothetical protein
VSARLREETSEGRWIVIQVGEFAVEMQVTGLVRRMGQSEPLPRKTRLSTRTGRKKPRRQGIQRESSEESPPAGTRQCRCGWCSSVWPHV